MYHSSIPSKRVQIQILSCSLEKSAFETVALSKMSNQAWFNLHKCISEAHRLHSGHVFVGRRSECLEGCYRRAQGWQKTEVLCNCHRLWPHVHGPEQRRYFKLIFLIDVESTWRKMFDLMGGLNRIFKFSLMMPNDPAVGPICGFFSGSNCFYVGYPWQQSRSM